MPMPKIHPHKKGGMYMNTTFGGKRISIYGATAEEVEKKYIQKCYEYGLGVQVGRHVLMKDYMRTWLSIHKGGIKPYTYDGYKTNVEKHIIPALGDMYLQQIHPADIKRSTTKSAKSASRYRQRKQSLTPPKRSQKPLGRRKKNPQPQPPWKALMWHLPSLARWVKPRCCMSTVFCTLHWRKRSTTK